MNFHFFFSPHSFLTGTNELAQSFADNSLCCLAGRILHLYSEGQRFVTLTNVFVVILLYFSFVSVIRRRGDCLRRICIVTSKVCDVLLSSVYILIKIPMIFFQFVFNGQQTFPDILYFTDSLQPTKVSPALKLSDQISEGTMYIYMEDTFCPGRQGSNVF